MERKPNTDSAMEVLRSVRDLQPAHYQFKIECFSLLLEEKIQKCESNVFEAGGYKWGLSFYPSGDNKGNGNGHISLYLVIRDTDNIQGGWEVNVEFKLLVYDHIRGNYLTIQDAHERTRRFHKMKTEWGFGQLLSLDTFRDSQYGYLFNDSCVFGAEVFVIKYDGKGECLSMIREPNNNTYTWEIRNFSTIKEVHLYSEEFVVGGKKWKLSMYPKGNATAKGKALSLFLAVGDPEMQPHNWKIYAKFKLRIRRQSLGCNDVEYEASCWFSASQQDWGFYHFLGLGDLNDSANCSIVKDTLVVEAEIKVMSKVQNFP